MLYSDECAALSVRRVLNNRISINQHRTRENVERSSFVLRFIVDDVLHKYHVPANREFTRPLEPACDVVRVCNCSAVCDHGASSASSVLAR